MLTSIGDAAMIQWENWILPSVTTVSPWSSICETGANNSKMAETMRMLKIKMTSVLTAKMILISSECVLQLSSLYLS